MAAAKSPAAKSSSSPKRGRPVKPKPAQTTLGTQAEGSPSRVQPAAPTQPYGVRTEIRGRYRTFPSLQRSRDYLAKLPSATDDLSQELGIDVLERMYNDPQISASIETLILQTLSKGIRCKPRYSDRAHPYYKQGIEAYDFISYCLDYTHDDLTAYLEIGLTETLEDLLRARLKFGNGAAEMTFRINNTGNSLMQNKLVPSFITVQEPQMFGLVVDPYKRVPGLAVYTGEGKSGDAENTKMMGIHPESHVALMDTGLPHGEIRVEDLPPGWQTVPISKFLYTWHRSKNGDLRGQSVLRPAFNPWVLTVQLYPEYLKYLRQFASPSAKGILPENARRKRDPVTRLMVDPKEALFEALCEFANGSAIAADFGTEIDLLFSQGEGMAFVQALNLLNHEKVKAILHAILGSETSAHQTRAAATTHKDIQDLPVRGLKNGITSLMHRQFGRRLMYWNYGPDAARLYTPYFTLGDLAPEDRNASLDAWAGAGYEVQPSQYTEISNELELPPPSPEELDLMLKKRQMESEPPPAPLGGTGGARPAAKPAAKPAGKPAQKRAVPAGKPKGK